MMMKTGFDTAQAPAPALARAILDDIGGSWVLVYVGGPRSGGIGWMPQTVKDYVAAGITEFLPCYVGLQYVPAQGMFDALVPSKGDASYGYRDGLNAGNLMRAFDFPSSSPCFLDVEYDTAARMLEDAVVYCAGWCKGVRDSGYDPGIYAPGFFLARMAKETNRPTFAFVASWVARGVDHSLSPEHITGLDDNLYKDNRAWQYAGDGVTVRGVGVDIDCSNCRLASLVAPPKPPPAPLNADYAAGAWIAALDGLVSGVAIKDCVVRKAQVQEWVKIHL